MTLTATPGAAPNEWIVTGEDADGAPVEITVYCPAGASSATEALRLAQGAGQRDEGALAAALLADALHQVEVGHAALMRRLTGSATPEERDTWTIKAAAARAVLADTASPPELAMITAEAEGGGETPAQLAQRIVGKADSFMALVGLCGRLRAQGRAAITAAAATEVPTETPGAIAAALEAWRAAVKAAEETIPPS